MDADKASILKAFVRDIESVDSSGEDVSAKVIGSLEVALRTIVNSSKSDYEYQFCGVRSAVEDIFADLPQSSASILCKGLAFAAKVAIDAINTDGSMITRKDDETILMLQLPEPSPGLKTDRELTVTRLQCLEILSAGFFGIIHRPSGGSRKRLADEKDMPDFSFEKLWAYDSTRWKTKNLVLMGVLLYFWQASIIGEESLRAEHLRIIRKAVGECSSSPSALFCPFDLQQDRVSIHDFMGDENLQADFANKSLGGGVFGGGGSQEESMFVEHTELLVTVFLVEVMLPFEAIEIVGAKKYVELNLMAARRCKREDQFCRAVEASETTVTAVALDAICFNSWGEVSKDDQYQSVHILREMRKCIVALQLPSQHNPLATRNFVTGMWGCGAFRGDPELKCIIQWMCCSLVPSVQKIIFCPFDQHNQLVKSGLAELIEKLQGKVRVQTVLSLLLEDPEYLQSSNTFQYLLKKLGSVDGT